MARLAGQRLSYDGVLAITARCYRTQERNRADAIERLTALIRSAAVLSKARKPSRPSATQRRQRLMDKRQRAEVKSRCKRPTED